MLGLNSLLITIKHDLLHTMELDVSWDFSKQLCCICRLRFTM